MLIRDADGDYVKLDVAHLTLVRADGTPLDVTPPKNAPVIVSVLVDLSSSTRGFNTEISQALQALSGSIAATGSIALYEFGSNARPTKPASNAEPCERLFASYRISDLSGGKALDNRMGQACRDLNTMVVLYVVGILSDCAPSDRSSKTIAENVNNIRPFVLWVGQHTTDHIAKYSAAHAISKRGADNENTAFLATSIATTNAHQTFKVNKSVTCSYDALEARCGEPSPSLLVA